MSLGGECAVSLGPLLGGFTLGDPGDAHGLQLNDGGTSEDDGQHPVNLSIGIETVRSLKTLCFGRCVVVVVSNP